MATTNALNGRGIAVAAPIMAQFISWHGLLRVYRTIPKERLHICVIDWLDKNAWLRDGVSGPPSPYACDHYKWEDDDESECES